MRVVPFDICPCLYAYKLRNVHLIISQILHGHDELIMDFIGVLNHPEAKWGVGDFLMPSSWNAPTHYRNSSEYLEPQQEQQVQPPSMPSDWYVRVVLTPLWLSLLTLCYLGILRNTNLTLGPLLHSLTRHSFKGNM
jgi:hypothetical protein